MGPLKTLRQDIDEFSDFLESLPHPPGNEARLLTQAFRTALQSEGPSRTTSKNQYIPARKTVGR